MFIFQTADNHNAQNFKRAGFNVVKWSQLGDKKSDWFTAEERCNAGNPCQATDGPEQASKGPPVDSNRMTPALVTCGVGLGVFVIIVIATSIAEYSAEEESRPNDVEIQSPDERPSSQPPMAQEAPSRSPVAYNPPSQSPVAQYIPSPPPVAYYQPNQSPFAYQQVQPQVVYRPPIQPQAVYYSQQPGYVFVQAPYQNQMAKRVAEPQKGEGILASVSDEQKSPSSFQ